MGKMKGQTVTHFNFDEYVPESGQWPAVGRPKPPAPVTTLPKTPPPAVGNTYYVTETQYIRLKELGYV